MVKLLFILVSVNSLPLFGDNGSTLTYFPCLCAQFSCAVKDYSRHHSLLVSTPKQVLIWMNCLLDFNLSDYCLRLYRTTEDIIQLCSHAV